MTPRPMLALVLVSTLAGCAASKDYAQKSQQLDGYELPRPIAEAWPEALRFLHARGYELVGNDRKVLGDEPSVWSALFNRGHETWVQGKRWSAETAMTPRYTRYRVLGTATSPTTCRIEFHLIAAEDPGRLNDRGGAEMVSRDVDLELAFVETLDPAAAARMGGADPSNQPVGKRP